MPAFFVWQSEKDSCHYRTILSLNFDLSKIEYITIKVKVPLPVLFTPVTLQLNVSKWNSDISHIEKQHTLKLQRSLKNKLFIVVPIKLSINDDFSWPFKIWLINKRSVLSTWHYRYLLWWQIHPEACILDILTHRFRSERKFIISTRSFNKAAWSTNYHSDIH